MATNRKARHEYFIEETYEAGMVLTGTEIKSVRAGKVSLQEGFVLVRSGEAWLLNVHIAPYEQGNRYNHEELRERKLLLNRREIAQLYAAATQRGYTIVPLRVYINDRGSRQDRDRRCQGQTAPRQARQHRPARKRPRPAPGSQR